MVLGRVSVLFAIALSMFVGCTSESGSPDSTESDLTWDPLRAHAANIDRMYREAGTDNNYVASKYVVNSDPILQGHKALSGEAEVRASLEKCVFIREGASGDHITEKQQESLSLETWEDFNGSLNSNFKFYEIPNTTIGGDAISANCLFEIATPGRSLLLEGASAD